MELGKTLNKKMSWFSAVSLGAVITACLCFADYKLSALRETVRSDIKDIEAAMETSNSSLEDLRALKELKLKDLSGYKEALKGLTKSRKAVFDTGVSLQEEKRLLEKQLEIMATYLVINEGTGKISVMRGDHSLNDWPFPGGPLRLFGEGVKNMPLSARVISKERFAQPERGKVEEVDGKISWNPPQAGKDARSAGLGEFVIFTDSPLILHGPPLNKELHEAFPHICAGITAYTAKRLYENTFIGTKILYTAAVTPAPADLPPQKTEAAPAAKGKKKK